MSSSSSSSLPLPLSSSSAAAVALVVGISLALESSRSSSSPSNGTSVATQATGHGPRATCNGIWLPQFVLATIFCCRCRRFVVVVVVVDVACCCCVAAAAVFWLLLLRCLRRCPATVNQRQHQGRCQLNNPHTLAALFAHTAGKASCQNFPCRARLLNMAHVRVHVRVC